MTQGLRVLLARGAGYLAEELREQGHAVDVCPSSPLAVATARAHSLDVAVIDLDGMEEGFTLAKQIRSASPWRKPMVVALAQTTGCEGCCREAGIDLLLVKPVAAKLLAGFLDRLLRVVNDYDSFDPMI